MNKVSVDLSTFVFPNPCILISCGSLEHPNVCTVAWCSTACGSPPMLTVAMRPTRFSYQLIVERRCFVVNIPVYDQLRVVDYAGQVSGRDQNKFALLGITARKACKVDSVIIEECPVNIECELVEDISLGSHHLLVARVVHVQADEDIIDNGTPVFAKLRLIAYVQKRYHEVGHYLGKYGFTIEDNF